MAMVPDTATHRYPPCGPTVTPPPFGDVTTRELIGAIITDHQRQPTVRRLDLGRRGATIDDARAELRRRSAVGRD